MKNSRVRAIGEKNNMININDTRDFLKTEKGDSPIAFLIVFKERSMSPAV